MNRPLPTPPTLAADAPAPLLRGAPAVWQVRLLGGFEIDDGRQRHTRLRSRAAMALLARIALAPGRDHAREELSALLWPDADAATGRNRLRQTLSLLKSALEPPGAPTVLLAERRVLRAAPGAFWCDAAAFEQAARAGQAAAARQLYRGELLPGFYDEWIHDERLRLATLAEGLEHGAGVAGAATPTVAPSPVAPAPAGAMAAPASQAVRLPHYLTRLIGADVAGARLLALVAAQRLVSVLGPGGCGKTRLAVEVARHAVQGAPAQPTAGSAPAGFDGACFVSLVEVQGRTALLDRLLAALRLGGGGDALEQVQQALAGRRQLVLLDNAEQLDDDALAAIAALAAATPTVHWLVTSRRPLELDGEHHFLLDALPLPAPGLSPDELAMNPAVALYTDRARAQRPDFQPAAGPPAQRAALAALVQRLGGLPLALELAASHARTLGPAELLALLDSARAAPGAAGLAYLARRGARSGSDPRHASMLAVVESSWRLLDGAQRQLLCALSQLPGGALPALAAALAGPLDGAAPGPLAGQALLDGLLAQSVLRAQAGQDGALRYAPHEPVREYALAQVDDTAGRATRHALLDWQLHWAAAMPATPPLPSVRDELPNLTLALSHAGADGRADDAARLVLLLQSSWGEIALPGGVLQAIDALLASPGLDPCLAAGCHALAAVRCQEAGLPDDARRHAAQALARLDASAAPDPAVQVMVLGRVARILWRLDRDHVRARSLIQQALPLARAAGRPNSEASLLSLEAHLCTLVDRDPQRATALSAQALALWQQSGNRHLVNAGRFNLATNRMKAGAHAEVLDEFAALADEGRALQDWDLAAGALEARGTALQGLRRWAESAADLREAVRLAWDGLEMMALAYALWNLTPALLRLRQATLAAETMGAAEALWLQRFGQLDAHDRRDLARIRRGTRVLLGADAARAAWQRGAGLPLGAVVRAVLAAPG